jgi:hypothetical protein
VKKKRFIFIIQNNNKNRKHIKIKNEKDKSLLKKLKHEPNIVEITHLCIRHRVHTSIGIKWSVKLCSSSKICPPKGHVQGNHCIFISQPLIIGPGYGY